MLRQSSYNRHWMERQAGLDFNCSWATWPRTCLTHTLKLSGVWFWQGTLEDCPYFSSSCEPGHQLLLHGWMLTLTLALLTAVDSSCTCSAIVSHAKNLNIWHNRFVFSVSFTSNWCRKSFIEAWHWEKILIQNSTISSSSLSGDKNANRLEKMSVAAHRTCDCPEFKFWTDITGLEAQLLDSCLFFCFFPWHATDLTHPGPSCFWKYSEILIAFIRFFFCVCVSPRAIFQVNWGNMKRWCKPL